MSPIDDAALPAHLDLLAERLTQRAPLGADGAPAQLAALMPAEPVIGEVALACWVDPQGNEQFDLVALADGSPNTDHTALRETLTLLAMTETLEELASFDALEDIREELTAWMRDAGDAADERLLAHIDRGLDALAALGELAPAATGRVARTTQLDALSEALRLLENSWELLEQSAELWSDAQIGDESAADHDARVERVRELWRALSGARRGPLATNPATAVHAGREAGVALAKAIADAGRD